MTMIAGLSIVSIAGFLIYLLTSNVDILPKPFLRGLGLFLIGVSTFETLLILWILVYIVSSDQATWSLSLDAFWREKLAAIYFIKQWLYTWFWNDLLDLILVYLPALVFLTIRTTFTTVIGFWALAASKR